MNKLVETPTIVMGYAFLDELPEASVNPELTESKSTVYKLWSNACVDGVPAQYIHRTKEVRLCEDLVREYRGEL